MILLAFYDKNFFILFYTQDVGESLMKKKFLKSSIKLIRDYDPSISDIKIEEISYGLESIYLTFTKLIIIFCLAFIFKIEIKVLTLLIFYNIIRINAFGLHATKSIYCLITSLLLFIGGVYVAEWLHINLFIKIIVSTICVVCLFKYAPADTEKRPLVNKKKRTRYKFLSTLSGVIYTILIIKFNNNIVSNYLLIGMIESVLMIHPAIYKFFKLPYNNYKNYECGV